MNPLRKLRLRWSLRGSMIGVLVLGVLLARSVNSVKIQADAVREIQRCGGHVTYRWFGGGTTLDDAPASGKAWLAWLVDHVGADHFRDVDAVEFRIERFTPDPERVLERFDPRVTIQVGRLAALTSFLAPNSSLSDDDLAPLAGLKNLRILDLSSTEVAGAGLVHLRGMTRLTHLEFWGAPFVDSDVEYLAGLTALESLRLGMVDVTDVGMEHLRSLHNLRSLNLERSSLFTSRGLAALGGCPKLEVLDLSCTEVDGLDDLPDLPVLRYLHLGSTQCGDRGLASIGRFAELDWLDVSSTKVTDVGLCRLAALRRLKTIRIMWTRATGATLACLAALPKLKLIKVGTTAITRAEADAFRARTGATVAFDHY